MIRECASDQLAYRVIAIAIGRTQVATQQPGHVIIKLFRERLVKLIGLRDVRFNLWRQHALIVERPAGRGVHHQKCEHNNQQ